MFLGEYMYSIRLETVETMVTAFLWLLYNGLSKEEALIVKRSDIDFENKQIVVDGKTFKLYDESVVALYSAYNMTQIVNGRGYVDLYNTECLLRTRTEFTLKVISNCIYKINRYIEKGSTRKVYPDDVYLSGEFYRLWLLEKKGRMINFDKLIKERIEGKEYMQGKDFAYLDNQRTLQHDYNIWKTAFNLK
jgi:hypothetical protein